MAARSRNTQPTLAPTGASDLTSVVRRWRDGLAEQPSLTGEALDELETHLRDSIDTLQASGLSPEEAFLVAVRRVGAPQVLGREFAKVRPQTVWMDRALWMLIGVQLWVPVSGVLASLAATVVAYGYAGRTYYAGSEIIGPATMFALAQLLALALSLMGCAWLILRKGPRIAGWLGPRLRHWWTFAAAVVVLFVASFTAMAVGRVVRAVIGFPGPANVAFGFAFSIVQVLQILIFVVFTLLLIRRRYELAEE